jgi:predicted metal-dependent hydrolase
MTELSSIRFGDTSIDYTVVRSVRRKKTIEITLDHQDGVLVAAPSDTPPQQVADVVRKRGGWIIRKATESILYPLRKELVSGESIPYLGRQAKLLVEPGNVKKVKVAFSHWSFRVALPYGLVGEERRSAIAQALEKWYKGRAADRLTDRVGRWAPEVGCEPREVLIRNQRQRWGSCSPDGTLRFNWRVIQVEPCLIDYVVVHELVHCLVRNHSASFWDEVSRVLPDYRVRRQRLKEAGMQVVL